jgi:hypothetical protein
MTTEGFNVIGGEIKHVPIVTRRLVCPLCGFVDGEGYVTGWEWRAGIGMEIVGEIIVTVRRTTPDLTLIQIERPDGMVITSHLHHCRAV